MRILLINAEQDERLFATFKHEHILYDQQPESDTLDISENIYDVIVYNATKLDEKTVDAVRSLRESGDMTPLLVMAGHTTARARIRILNADVYKRQVLPYACGFSSPAASGNSANTFCTPQPASCASLAASVESSSYRTKCACPSAFM